MFGQHCCKLRAQLLWNIKVQGHNISVFCWCLSCKRFENSQWNTEIWSIFFNGVQYKQKINVLEYLNCTLKASIELQWRKLIMAPEIRPICSGEILFVGHCASPPTGNCTLQLQRKMQTVSWTEPSQLLDSPWLNLWPLSPLCSALVHSDLGWYLSNCWKYKFGLEREKTKVKMPSLLLTWKLKNKSFLLHSYDLTILLNLRALQMPLVLLKCRPLMTVVQKQSWTPSEMFPSDYTNYLWSWWIIH